MSGSIPTPTSTEAAEERLAMLRRLATLGMRLAEEIVERAVNSPYHPEADHEPGRAFAAVSRAVRLTLVLQAKFESGSITFRNGDGKPETAPRPRPVATPAEDGIEGDDEIEAIDRARESLCDSESYDETRGRPFDDCVAAVRVDLGLDSDEDLTRPSPHSPSEPAMAGVSPAEPRPPDPPTPAESWSSPRGHWPEPPKPPGTGSC